MCHCEVCMLLPPRFPRLLKLADFKDQHKCILCQIKQNCYKNLQDVKFCCMKGSTEQLFKHIIIFKNSEANYLPAKDA
jgi:hypothetical protein